MEAEPAPPRLPPAIPPSSLGTNCCLSEAGLGSRSLPELLEGCWYEVFQVEGSILPKAVDSRSCRLHFPATVAFRFLPPSAWESSTAGAEEGPLPKTCPLTVPRMLLGLLMEARTKSAATLGEKLSCLLSTGASETVMPATFLYA